MDQRVSARVAVVDYGMGNLGSVLNAFRHLGIEASGVARPTDLVGATHLVLPGVGAFGDGMAHLRDGGWIEPLRALVLDERLPVLGICLGMQLLLDSSEEHGLHEGLGWVPGAVRRLPGADGARVPHIGWNDVRPVPGSVLFAGLGELASFYFVHSYVAHPVDAGDVAGTSDHGVDFVAAVEHGNILGVQFHPEKSHRAGLQLLRNFATAEIALTC